MASPSTSPVARSRLQYLVTGGSGFLGQHLVSELLRLGHGVRVLSRSMVKDLQLAGAEILQGDVLDASVVESAMQGVDGVFHLAGLVEHSRRNPKRISDLCLRSIDVVLNSAKAAGIRRVVYASTSGTVAVSLDPGFIGTDASPFAIEVVDRWPYYASKIQSEILGRRLAEKLDLELVIMRPSLLLGPGDTRLSSCRSILDALKGKVPYVPSGGISFVDTRDVAVAFVAAMTRGSPGSSYLLASANMSLREYFQRIEKLSGRPGPRLVLPSLLTWLAWILAWLANAVVSLCSCWNPTLDPVVVEMATHHWNVDSQAARQELGFTTRSPDETLRDTIRWLREHML